MHTTVYPAPRFFPKCICHATGQSGIRPPAFHEEGPPGPEKLRPRYSSDDSKGISVFLKDGVVFQKECFQELGPEGCHSSAHRPSPPPAADDDPTLNHSDRPGATPLRALACPPPTPHPLPSRFVCPQVHHRQQIRCSATSSPLTFFKRMFWKGAQWSSN